MVRSVSTLKPRSNISKKYHGVEVEVIRENAVELLNNFYGETYNASRFTNLKLQTIIDILHEKGVLKSKIKIKGIFHLSN